MYVRDWSLITGIGGGALRNRRGGGAGHLKFYPYEKGSGKSLNHAEGVA